MDALYQGTTLVGPLKPKEIWALGPGPFGFVECLPFRVYENSIPKLSPCGTRAL
jgi:hypothetical protein